MRVRLGPSIILNPPVKNYCSFQGGISDVVLYCLFCVGFGMCGLFLVRSRLLNVHFLEKSCLLHLSYVLFV